MLDMHVSLTWIQYQLLLEQRDAVFELIEATTGARITALGPDPIAVITAESDMRLVAAEIELKRIIATLMAHARLPEQPRRPVFFAVETFMLSNQTISTSAGGGGTSRKPVSRPRYGSESIPRGIIHHPSLQRPGGSLEQSLTRGHFPSAPPLQGSSSVVIRMPADLQRRFGSLQAAPPSPPASSSLPPPLAPPEPVRQTSMRLEESMSAQNTTTNNSGSFFRRLSEKIQDMNKKKEEKDRIAIEKALNALKKFKK